MEKQAIVRTIVDLARSLGMSVIAEGVETMEQSWSWLRSFGCLYRQGFLFDEPLPPEEAEQRRDCSRLVVFQPGRPRRTRVNGDSGPGEMVTAPGLQSF